MLDSEMSSDDLALLGGRVVSKGQTLNRPRVKYRDADSGELDCVMHPFPFLDIEGDKHRVHARSGIT